MIPRKPKVTVTMDQDILDWVDGQVRIKAFGSRSHLIEKSILAMKDSMAKSKAK